MLALTHQVRAKDCVRAHSADGTTGPKYMGSELRDRTLGIVGLGGIGRALVDLLRGFGMKTPIAFDPYAKPELASQAGVALVSLDELAALGRLRFDPLSVDRANAKPDRRPGVGADEAGRLLC